LYESGSGTVSPGPPSALEDSHRPHRRAGAAADLERQADKTKTSPADQLVQIDHVLVVRKTQLSADPMNFLVGNSRHTGRHRLDAKGGDLLHPQPTGGSHANPGSLGPIARPEGAPVVIGIQQNRIPRLDI